MPNTDEPNRLFQESAALFDENKYEEAILALTQAIRLAPDRSVYYYQRHAALRWLKRNDEALSDINSAILLAPREPGLYVARAYTHCAIGNHPAALADLRVATETAPGNFDVLSDAGRIRAQIGDYEDALALFDRAMTALASSTGLLLTRTVVKRKHASILYYRGLAHHGRLCAMKKQVSCPGFLGRLRIKKVKRLAEADLSTSVALGLPSDLKEDALAKLDALRAVI